MTAEDNRGSLINEDAATDRFPVGMRVLAVDDDPICLKVLETLLRKCQYQVTTANQAITALKMLRENRNKYDLVISDVNMPDMDGFKLLELVGLEMDLPVIMLSAHSDTKLVMKGIAHGACDYLLKPVRVEELKNIWQHVVRRKKFDSREQNKSSNQEKAHFETGEGGQGATSAGNTEQNGKFNKKRKDQSEDEEEDGEENGHENEDPSTQKKPRVVWSVELHRKFVAAVNQLGLDKAVPKKILDLMNVEGLTRENVASHLQKYRLYLKRISNVTSQQANMVAAFGGKDPCYLRMGQLDGFGDFRTLTGPGRLSSTALAPYPQGGILGRLNSPAGLTLRGISSSSMIQPGHSQTLSNSNALGKLQTTMLPSNQNSNLFHGIPTALELNQISQSKSANHIGDFNHINDQTVFTVATSFPDARVMVGSSSNSAPTTSGNPLMLLANSQQTQSRVAFGNQSSLAVASLNTESLDRIFASNSLPRSESFTHDQVPTTNLRDNISLTSSHIGNGTVDFSPCMSTAAPLEDSRVDVQCETGLIGNVIRNVNYSAKQRWEENRLNYNSSLNNKFSNTDSPASANVLMDQSNTVRSKSIDVSLIGQLHSAACIFQHAEGEKSALDAKLRSSEEYLLEQSKSQDGIIQNNYDSLEDIMSAMMKREQNGAVLIDGEFGLDAYSLGSCI